MANEVISAVDKKDRLKLLIELAKSFEENIHLDDLWPVLIAEVVNALDAERSSMFLYDAESRHLCCKAVEKPASPLLRIPVGAGAAGHAAQLRSAVNIVDAYKDPRFDPALDKVFGVFTRSVLAVPMLSQNQELVGVLEVVNKIDGGPFTQQDEELLRAICTHLCLALNRAETIGAYLRAEKMQQSLHLAREIQMGLLPKAFPAFPDKPEIDIWASVRPALEVGGDLYDFFPLDEDHIFFLIGDASDKGIPAAMFMAIVKTAFQISVQGGVLTDGHEFVCARPDAMRGKIASVMRSVNSLLYRNNESYMFVTAFAGILNLRTGEIEYSDGGHEPPFVIHNGSVEMLNKRGGVALGVVADHPFSVGTIQLQPGDTLVLYTDGVNEAMNGRNQMFCRSTIAHTLADLSLDVSPEQLVGAVFERVSEFAAGAPQSDDITVMAIKYRGSGVSLMEREPYRT
jgi:serine phosphatase RsbU (regulator of sigma subunit)/putative methionine-R-sulfoxide reductase with GAF domain